MRPGTFKPRSSRLARGQIKRGGRIKPKKRTAGPAEAAPAKERVCLRCMKHEDITEANADAVHIVVDGGAIWMPTNKTTGKDIKVAARIDPAFKLWVEGGPEWAAKGGDETPIGDDDIVGLVEGVRFMSVPPGVF